MLAHAAFSRHTAIFPWDKALQKALPPIWVTYGGVCGAWKRRVGAPLWLAGSLNPASPAQFGHGGAVFPPTQAQLQFNVTSSHTSTQPPSTPLPLPTSFTTLDALAHGFTAVPLPCRIFILHWPFGPSPAYRFPNKHPEAHARSAMAVVHWPKPQVTQQVPRA